MEDTEIHNEATSFHGNDDIHFVVVAKVTDVDAFPDVHRGPDVAEQE